MRIPQPTEHQPWNKGRLVGQKRPLKSRDIWTTRARLPVDDLELLAETAEEVMNQAAPAN
jgi:hypothetical protein